MAHKIEKPLIDLSSDKIAEFYKDYVLVKYPDLTEAETRNIIKAPFQLFKGQCLQGEILQDFRLPTFGIFKVIIPRIKAIRKCLLISYERGNMTEEHYNAKVNMGETFIKNYKKHGEKGRIPKRKAKDVK